MSDDYQTIILDPDKLAVCVQAASRMNVEIMYHVEQPDGSHVFGSITPDGAAHCYRSTTQMWEAFRDKFMEGTDDDE